ncbi:MAG: alpha-2-macroglobulin, partial [Treponema sp.]|nr:alpha-2-macroglobulin [Treponema sp.]
AGLFTIEPPLAGVYRWYGTKLLSFESDAESLPQQRYTITVSGEIRSLGGKTLQGEKSFSFETERLSVLSWNLGRGDYWINRQNVNPADAKHIGMIFSCPVNLAEIARWIEVRAAGQTFPFTLSRPEKIDGERYRPEQAVLLGIDGELPLDTEVTMVLKEGARSEADWLGTREARSWNYHTLRPFRYEDISVRTHSSPRTEEGDSIPVSLHFSQDVEPEGAEKYFSIDGLPALKKENIHVYGNTVVINRMPLEYRKNYTVRISGNLKDLYGRPLGGDVQDTAQVGEANSYVYILNQGSRMLEAGFPPRIIWETQNPVSLRRALGAVRGPYARFPGAPEAIDPSLIPANSKRYFMEDLSPFLNAAGRGTASLHWVYRTKSGWQSGKIDSGEAWLTVQVTDIGITVRYAYNMVLVWATHISDGSPAAGARVELLEGEETVVEGRADGQGLAVFEFPDGDFTSRFTQPETNMGGGNSTGSGFRVRVSEDRAGRGAAGAQATAFGLPGNGDCAEFIPNDSHNLWRFNIEAAASPFTVERRRPVIFLFTDRGLYRPGETLSFRGIDRNLNRGVYEACEGPYDIEVSADAYEAPVLAGLKGDTTKTGGFYGSFTLPEKLDPGRYRISYRRSGSAARQNDQARIVFTVANFERLRFETSLKFPDVTFYQGEKLNALLSASWLAGGGLSGAPYTWYWTREPAGFMPGDTWRYWRFGPELDDGRYHVASGEGVLGPDGRAGISQETGAGGIAGAAYRYRVEASVQDASRQEIAGRAAALVHPASFYIAARLDSGTPRSAAEAGSGPAAGSRAPFAASSPSACFLPAGRPAALSWVLVSPDGGPWLPGADGGELSLQLVRYEWKQARQAGVGGRINLVWERVEETVEEKTFKIEAGRGALEEGGSGTDFISGVFGFTPGRSGQWEVRLRGRDQQGRPAVTSFGFFTSGAGWVRWGSGDVDAISLVPDKQRYAPGETAKILVRSPLEKGKYLLTLEREGILSRRIIELEGSALAIDVPVEESWVPVVYVSVSSYTVRSGPPENTYYEPDLDKPRGIFGITPVYVENGSRHYQVEIEPSKAAYRPAGQAEVKIRVSLNGKPAPGTEVSFMAVDRGVVDLIDYHVPDPIAFFYDPANFPLGVRGADSRSLLIDPVTYALSDLQGGDSGDESKIEERRDFRPTAVFEPCLVTGADGTVTVKFGLPDSLTTYRCTALAAGLHDFGIKEHDLRVSAPLTALAALPRKLRWRDTGTVSLILTNLENETVEAQVSLETETAGAPGPWDSVLEVDGADSKSVRIRPGDSGEVRFTVAAVGAGESRLTFTLRSPGVNERIIKTLTVDRPVVTETVSAIGSLGGDDAFIEEGMVLPSLVPEGTGNVTVTLAVSRLAALREAVRYLLDYPYGCLEQRTARLLPLVAFGDHLEAFSLESPVKNPKRLVEDELSQLAGYQLSDGSFPYWPGGGSGDVFVSLRVAHIAALAGQKGMRIPPELNTRRMLSYIVSAGNAGRAFSADPFLKGYSLWVRAMYGERIGTEISEFLKRGDELGISGWSFAGLAALELGQRDLAASARDRVRRFIRPGTRGLDLADTYERRGNYWGYDADRYALALMVYGALNPGDDMTTRLATALIERQRRGVWTNTASSFWAVLAFGRISDMEAAEWKAAAPGQGAAGAPLAARASLGGAPLFSAQFDSRGGTPVSFSGAFAEAPLRDLGRDTLLPLRIERDGPARLYYTASLRYGIPAELAGARDEGLGVFVETFDSGGRVAAGRLAPGKTYTRRIILSSSRDRTHVALRAPVPSGAEII